MKKYQIRKLDKKNVTSCYTMIIEEENFNKYKNYNGWSIDNIYESINKIEYLCFGLFKNKILIGFIISKYIKNEDFSEIEILLILVKKKFRRKGIGKTLIDYTQNYVKISNMYIEFSNLNIVAKRFYKSYGFDSISKRKGYYILKNGTKEDAEIYKFNL